MSGRSWVWWRVTWRRERSRGARSRWGQRGELSGGHCHGEHVLVKWCWSSPVVFLALSRVSEVGFSARVQVDKVSGSGVVCRLLWHLMAMDVLGLAVHGLGSGSTGSLLAWAAPDMILGVSGWCLAR